ncbi:DUF6544 family protein [Candidatus Poribacteria bacterium]
MTGRSMRIMLIGAITILLIALITVSIGGRMFRRQVKQEVTQLFEAGTKSGGTFTYDQIEALPDPVQRYFRYALKEWQTYISYARLKHTGTFRTTPGKKWMPIAGEQYFATEKPGFVWFAKVKPFPLFWIAARDRYFQGKGNVLIKLYSTITIGNSNGKEVDQGSLLRFLGEAAWFPTALLPGEQLHWESVDDRSAKVIFSDRGIDVSALVHFNDKGKITDLVADRYKDTTLERWTGSYMEYKEMHGVMIPTMIEAVWNLGSGNFSYAKFRITEIEYNNPSVYK